jgi:hypothetical protein
LPHPGAQRKLRQEFEGKHRREQQAMVEAQQGAEASGDYQVVEMAPPTTELDLSTVRRVAPAKSVVFSPSL